MRSLVIILGDQLDPDSAAFDGFDRDRDAVWMAEVSDEAEHVWSHKARIALFLSAMRHFRDRLIEQDIRVHYRELDDPGNRGSLAGELAAALEKHRPDRLVLVEPGEWRVKNELETAAIDSGVELDLRSDRSFICTHREFEQHAASRKQLRLEYFYRELRSKHAVLMQGKKPAGGKWNFDSDNRRAFGNQGPEDLPKPRSYSKDDVTRDVVALVLRRFADHPGSLDDFDWPVTPEQAKLALEDFVDHRLVRFGEFQDAMWTGEPYLYHSRISVALNLKLLDPRKAIAQAEAAFGNGSAPLNSVEGFVRQILGWREYVRGIYWRYMPKYIELNALDARAELPDFFWTGDTDFYCLRHTILQTLKTGYAHHIQRLMVTGLFALLFGVDPRSVHEWYLAVYVDAVEWVELPNSLGMSQYADGGIIASKPYVASGKYIQRMSNYCAQCRFDPAESVGETACPFTTLYWDFLARHERVFESNRRMKFQIANLKRKSKDELTGIRARAGQLRTQLRA